MTSPTQTLKTYRRIGKILPFVSLRAKVFAVAICAIHFPLLALSGFLVLNRGELPPMQTLALLFSVTLMGAGAALWALYHLLAPIKVALNALQTYSETHQVQPLPTDLRDEMGDLLRGVRMSLESGEERRNQLRQMAAEDALTGLPSRRNADEYLRLAHGAAERSGNSLSIAILDLDHFKKINDAFGRDTGDHALKTTAEFLKLWLRRRSDWIGRWTGDQFIAVMFEPVGDAVQFLDNLRREFARQMRGFENTGLSLSIGAAELRRNETLENCLKHAGEALHAAKREGRNRVVAPQPGLVRVTPAQGATGVASTPGTVPSFEVPRVAAG